MTTEPDRKNALEVRFSTMMPTTAGTERGDLEAELMQALMDELPDAEIEFELEQGQLRSWIITDEGVWGSLWTYLWSDWQLTTTLYFREFYAKSEKGER